MSNTDSSTRTSRLLPAPNHTQTPNAFFDEMLAEIDTMSELKVTLAIIRQTFGWHKLEDQISLSQLEKLTGLNRQQVVAGCKAALERGFVWREKREGRNYFGLNIEEPAPEPGRKSGGYDDHTPMQNAHGYDDHTSRGYDDHTHKRKGKESVSEFNNSLSGIGKTPDSALVDSVVGLEKFIVDRLYERMASEGYALDTSDFGYHLGRAQTMLEKMDPTDEEVSALPGACVEHFVIKQWTDAVVALRYMRQQKARPALLAQKRAESAKHTEGPAPWEPKNPHSPKPEMDPEMLAKEMARREEVARMLRSVS